MRPYVLAALWATLCASMVAAAAPASAAQNAGYVYTITQIVPTCTTFDSGAVTFAQVNPRGSSNRVTPFGQIITYGINSIRTQVTSWQGLVPNLPINLVIVTGASGSNAYIYGDGAYDDTILAAPGGATISTLTFCWGFQESPAEIFEIQRCSIAECPSEATPPFVNFKIRPDAVGDLIALDICQCNFELQECNKVDPTAENYCLEPGQNTLVELPVNIEFLNTGTGFCYQSRSTGWTCVNRK